MVGIYRHVFLLCNIKSLVEIGEDEISSLLDRLFPTGAPEPSSSDSQGPIGDLVSDVTDAAGDAISDVTDAVGDAVSDVTKAAGDLLSNAGNAVSDVASAVGDILPGGF